MTSIRSMGLVAVAMAAAIAFAASRDGGRSFSAPVRVSEDQWAIEGCPEDGPSLAVDRNGRVHVVWPTVVTEHNEPVKALFHAVSLDGKRSVREREFQRAGKPIIPSSCSAVMDRSPLRGTSPENGARRVVFARGSIATDGRVTFGRVAIGQRPPGSYPVIAALDHGLLASWTSGAPARSVIHVEVIQ